MRDVHIETDLEVMDSYRLNVTDVLADKENKRRTLQNIGIATAIGRTGLFDFPVDIVPRDEFKDDGLVILGGAGVVHFMGSGDNVPSYYYVAQQAPNMTAYVPPTQQMRSKALAHVEGSLRT